MANFRTCLMASATRRTTMPEVDAESCKPGAAAGGILQQDIQQPIRSHDHIAHPAEFLEQDFLAHDLAALGLQAQQFLSRQRAHEQIVLPARIFVAAVESDAAGRDRRRVEGDGRIGIGCALAQDARLQAHGRQAPAIIMALVDHIDLVAAGGTMLGFPQIARHGIERQAFGIAMAQTPDRRHGIGQIHERIVRRDRAVFVDAMDLAQRRGQALRIDHVVALADGEEQMALAIEQEARTIMIAGGGVER